MMDPEQPQLDAPQTPQAFVTTQWTLLREAANSQSPDFHAALEKICSDYWYPLYAFVRRSGKNAEEAQDLTQGFFEHLLTKRAFKQPDREMGRFRSFLLGSLKNYLINEHKRENRIKRGGDQVKVSLEWDVIEGRYASEPADDLTPDKLFERQWAASILSGVFKKLRDEFESADELDRYEALRFTLENPREVKYAELAERLDLTEAGVKSAVHRLRKRFRTILEETVQELVENPMDVEGEIRNLFVALR